MVGADELAAEAVAGGAVDDVTIDLAIAIDHTVLAGEVFVLGVDVKGGIMGSVLLIFFQIK